MQRLKGLDASQLSEYFSLDNCIEGLHKISQALFGVSIQQVEPSPTETWHPSVRKLVVTDETEVCISFESLLTTFRER